MKEKFSDFCLRLTGRIPTDMGEIRLADVLSQWADAVAAAAGVSTAAPGPQVEPWPQDDLERRLVESQEARSRMATVIETQGDRIIHKDKYIDRLKNDIDRLTAKNEWLDDVLILERKKRCDLEEAMLEFKAKMGW